MPDLPKTQDLLSQTPLPQSPVGSLDELFSKTDSSTIMEISDQELDQMISRLRQARVSFASEDNKAHTEGRRPRAKAAALPKPEDLEL